MDTLGWFWGKFFFFNVVKPIIWGNEGEMMGWLGWLGWLGWFNTLIGRYTKNKHWDEENWQWMAWFRQVPVMIHDQKASKFRFESIRTDSHLSLCCDDHRHAMFDFCRCWTALKQRDWSWYVSSFWMSKATSSRRLLLLIFQRKPNRQMDIYEKHNSAAKKSCSAHYQEIH